MEKKTTAEIIKKHEEIAEKILSQEPDIETYKGEFDQTYEKRWVTIDDLIPELKKIAPKGVSPYYDRVQKLITRLND